MHRNDEIALIKVVFETTLKIRDEIDFVSRQRVKGSHCTLFNHLFQVPLFKRRFVDIEKCRKSVDVKTLRWNGNGDYHKPDNNVWSFRIFFYLRQGVIKQFAGFLWFIRKNVGVEQLQHDSQMASRYQTMWFCWAQYRICLSFTSCRQEINQLKTC